VSEWFKEHAWNACIRETVSRVRISPSPPVLPFNIKIRLNINIERRSRFGGPIPFSILTLEPFNDDGAFAVLEHADQKIRAFVFTTKDQISGLSPSFTAELDYDEVLRHELFEKADDDASGIFPTGDPSVLKLDGTVHNHMPLEGGDTILDVYIQNGPEFLAVTSADLGGEVPAVGARLQVWVKGLGIFPVFY
jgi:hypothetical protein